MDDTIEVPPPEGKERFARGTRVVMDKVGGRVVAATGTELTIAWDDGIVFSLEGYHEWLFDQADRALGE